MAETALAYGESGAGKTSLAIGLSKWVYERWGLTTRLISHDLGGWKVLESEGLTDEKHGIIKTYNLAAKPDKLLRNIRRLGRGYWPKIVRMDNWEMADGSIRNNVPVVMIERDDEALAKVGLYVIEGCTSISDAFLKFVIHQETEDRGDGKHGKIGPQGVTGRFEQDGEVMGSNSEGHYGTVQIEMHSVFASFSALPVKMVFWTGHVGEGTFEGDKVMAPQLAGKKKNAKVPSWVGDCFHLSFIPEVLSNAGELVQQKEVRAYYEIHQDNAGFVEGAKFLAKSRMALTDLQSLRDRFPGGYVPLGTKPGEGLDQYYRWVEERKGANLQGLISWKEGIDKGRNG